ncbi:MAG: hypothetical protein RQ952_06315 [Thermoproteota archaeon]|nr:hypothetical protein [Thermoproteota archaeon]
MKYIDSSKETGFISNLVIQNLYVFKGLRFINIVVIILNSENLSRINYEYAIKGILNKNISLSLF